MQAISNWSISSAETKRNEITKMPKSSARSESSKLTGFGGISSSSEGNDLKEPSQILNNA